MISGGDLVRLREIGVLEEQLTHKITARLDKSTATSMGYTEQSWHANNIADQWADEATAQHQFQAEEIKLLDQVDNTTNIIVKRLLAVHSIVVEESQKVSEKERRPRGPTLRNRILHEGKQNGHSLVINQRVFCTKCKQKTNLKDSLDWIKQTCNSKLILGHTVETHRGITFCKHCGFWDSHGGTTSRGLQSKCPEQVKAHRETNLKRMVNRTVKPPYPLQRWPEAYPEPTGSCKRKLDPEGRDKEGAPTKSQRTKVVSKDCSGGKIGHFASRDFKPLTALGAIRARIQAKELAAVGAARPG